MSQKFQKKRRITKIDRNFDAHNVFKKSKLDTLASSASRIFLCEERGFRDGPNHAICSSM